MKKISITKLLIVLLSVFLLINVASQIYKAIYKPYRYETVVNYTTKDAVDFKGLFVRQENIISYNGGKSVVTYNFSDGTKVYKTAPIISAFDNKEDASRQLQIEALSKRIENLKASQSSDAIDASKLDNINMALDNKSAEFAKLVSENNYKDAKSTKDELINFLNRMSIIKGKCENFDGLINDLSGQVSTLQSQMSSTPEYIYTANAGYFMSNCDGYEYLNFDNISDLSVADVDEIISGGKKQESADAVGKILDNYYFKIAGIFDYNDVATLTVGGKVNLQIELNRTQIEATIDSVKADDSGKAVVIMTCDDVTDDYFQYRTSDVQLVKATYSGIRVPRSAIRFSNNERGVFVKSGSMIIFKRIDPIYENEEFVICNSKSEINELSLYDEIVTKGKDLYDNKSIE